MEMDDAYRFGFAIVWLVAFISTWIYCMSEYGFLWGFGLGWLPASILATIVAFLWPLLFLVVIGFIILVYWA